MYSHFEVPNGGRANDGNGFNSRVGNGVNGARPTDGKKYRWDESTTNWVEV